MTDIVGTMDMAAGFLPPLVRVILWGSLSAGFSMWIYAMLSPQRKMAGMKTSQKGAREALLAHEGDFKELTALVRADLMLSLTLIGLALGPFLLSLLPLIFLMIPLTELYTAPLVSFGPDWLQGFEFWYISVLVVASIVIKVVFKIA